MISLDKPNEEQLKFMAWVMEIFVGILGNIVAGIGKDRH